MSRYIDADILLKELLRCRISGMSEYNAALSTARKIVRQQPTAVEEVRQGYWIPITYGDCRCSICGNAYGLCGGLMGDYNYCPGCGAKMDKEKEK